MSAHAQWKIGPKSLIVLSNRQNFSHFMGNRSRWTRRYSNQITHSHEASQWKRPKFDPSPIFTKIGRRDYVLDGTRHAEFCSDRSTGFCSPNTWFCGAFGVTSLFVFWGSSVRLQPTPLDGYLREIRQMTSFRVTKCLLGVPMTIFYIWTL